MSGAVFDAGALIALDRNDRTVVVLVGEARRANLPIVVPAGCIAQVWRMPSRQARVAGFLRLPNVEVVPLDDEDARLVGLLLARTRTRDVVDAHVAVCAQRRDQMVLTSDPDDIGALVPSLRIVRV